LPNIAAAEYALACDATPWGGGGTPDAAFDSARFVRQLDESTPVVFANQHYVHLLRTSIDVDHLYSFETGLDKTNTLRGFPAPDMKLMLRAIKATFTPSMLPGPSHRLACCPVHPTA
jgi:hypothetical protein